MSGQIMPFGKWKGEYVSNLPRNYLRWLLNQGFIHGELEQAVKDTLDSTTPQEVKDKIREATIEEKLDEIMRQS